MEDIPVRYLPGFPHTLLSLLPPYVISYFCTGNGAQGYMLIICDFLKSYQMVHWEDCSDVLKFHTDPQVIFVLHEQGQNLRPPH